MNHMTDSTPEGTMSNETNDDMVICPDYWLAGIYPDAPPAVQAEPVASERPSSGNSAMTAEEAIGLFLEYRDKHGYSEELAAITAADEFRQAEQYAPPAVQQVEPVANLHDNKTAVTEPHPMLSPTHFCRDCRALWRQCDDFSMNLRSTQCCDKCNNAPVADQLTPLTATPGWWHGADGGGPFRLTETAYAEAQMEIERLRTALENLRRELDRAWREVDFIAKERTEHLEWRTKLANDLDECERMRDVLASDDEASKFNDPAHVDRQVDTDRANMEARDKARKA